MEHNTSVGLRIYDIIREESEKADDCVFDSSDYVPDNPYNIKLINKNVHSKFKDELNGQLFTEFIGLRSKMYLMRKEEDLKDYGHKENSFENLPRLLRVYLATGLNGEICEAFVFTNITFLPI
ncbi:hypothetical protein ILUMI_15283 [Ignelater luminosus]|uniref:Uncharacterized protein n=1 Tax=Ignelater luminosus TaxID=2038154 RepID=A0A8K0CWV2_IGNLU|nr:hypothetical protein ILUMI_15283 [Ignelater luminosus]